MVETEEEKEINTACIIIMKVYIAFVFTILGMLLGLLCTMLAKGGDPTLEIGLGIAVFLSMMFGVMAILDN